MIVGENSLLATVRARARRCTPNSDSSFQTPLHSRDQTLPHRLGFLAPHGAMDSPPASQKLHRRQNLWAGGPPFATPTGFLMEGDYTHDPVMSEMAISTQQ
jgi:hypothetical protein